MSNYTISLLLISMMLFSYNFCQEKDAMGFHKMEADAAFLLSYLGFCFLPRISMDSYAFFNSHQKTYNITKQEREWIYPDVSNYSRSLTYDPQDFKIPLTTHRVWVTHPDFPREMGDSMTKAHILDQMLHTNKVLEKALIEDPHHNPAHQQWRHYFWTNNKALIPSTVQLFEENGFIVKEISELEGYDAQVKKIYQELFDNDKIVTVADHVRMMILYEQGGFYLDVDFQIDTYSIDLHRLFEFFGFTLTQRQREVMFNFAALAKPYHDFPRLYLQNFLNEYKVRETTESYLRPFHLQECFYNTYHNIFYEVGPYMYDAAYIQHLRKYPNAQEATINVNYNGDHPKLWEGTYRTVDGKDIKISIAG